MRDYILGDKIISTTEEQYNKKFKTLGYVPVVKKTAKKVVEEEKKLNEFKKNDNIKRNNYKRNY